MCSILGYFNPKGDSGRVTELNHSLAHRGPDNSSVREYTFRGKPFFMGHNRLSIQDLSPLGNQPMENGRFAIVFNGEIYNHMEIRRELRSQNFVTHSDTETLLHAFEELGIEGTIDRLIGMFAIALFDKSNEKLYLIRDRIGIKPLYWSFQEGEFVFASEPKGIPSHMRDRVDGQSLIRFVALGYVPGERSYYDDVKQVSPATILVFDGQKTLTKRYWDIPKSSTPISFQDAVEEVESLIYSSVRYRLVSDVEVGAFLSGGIDSSLVSAIMSKVSDKQIKTFSIGFEESRYDESNHARKVARHIGSEHYEYRFGIDDIKGVIDDLEQSYDDPFGDPSALPFLLLSKKTKEQVSVALSGDGGDELFLGYNRYFFANQYHRRLKALPEFMRKLLAYSLESTKKDRYLRMAYPVRHPEMFNLYAAMSTAARPWELNRVFSDAFLHEQFGNQPSFLELLELEESEYYRGIEGLSRIDLYRYLPGDILTKVDRASMAFALEARVPLLDHRLVELAYSLPEEVKLHRGPKSILKELLRRHLPAEYIERPKQGFSVPLQEWFRGGLKEALREKIEGLDSRFNKDGMRELFREHLEGRRNHAYLFWNLMRLK